MLECVWVPAVQPLKCPAREKCLLLPRDGKRYQRIVICLKHRPDQIDSFSSGFQNDDLSAFESAAHSESTWGMHGDGHSCGVCSLRQYTADTILVTKATSIRWIFNHWGGSTHVGYLSNQRGSNGIKVLQAPILDLVIPIHFPVLSSQESCCSVLE